MFARFVAMPLLPAVWIAVAMLAACGQSPMDSESGPVTWAEIEQQPEPPGAERLAYNGGPQQFGELRLPDGPGPHPVAVMIHGGCWQAAYDLAYFAPLAQRLADAGIATWSLEYRRLGDAGGGWPGTFEDVARGLAHLHRLADDRPLDLERVVLIGHSAGGHLALWLAGRHRLPREDALFADRSVPLRGVVGIAAIADLEAYSKGSGSCNASARQLMSGEAGEVPDRYARANPVSLLPVGVPVRLVHGALDPIVAPAQSRQYVQRAKLAGDDVTLMWLGDAGHFDPVAPFSPAWPQVEALIAGLVSVEQ